MNCSVCKRVAKNGEAFWSLSWEKVNVEEFKARKSDGRTVYLDEVCPECMAAHNGGRPPLGLKDINNIRERGITEEEYYKEKGY